jgi:hypothetical protein
MSTGNGQWIGRKGRTPKVAASNQVDPRASIKLPKYARSDLLVRLNKIISLFTERQIALAGSTGFGAFAKSVHAVQFDKQFTMWLMPRVDTMNRTIGPVDGKRIMIFQEDAGSVFGVPFLGKEVYDSSLDKSEEMRQEVMELIGMQSPEAVPSEAA